MNIETATEIVDLGDATEETRQLLPVAVFLDSQYGLGLFPNIG